jgi:KaiC/GvpD/RAD55 family RecA-like ATPase
MANRMLDRLRSKDKKGLFNKTQTAISYPTGFTNLDYRNGYMVQVRDIHDQLVQEYPSTGLVGGSFITIVGKSGTAKTTAAVQWASNIVRPFDAGFVQHFDLEQALTYTRIRNINGMTTQQLEDKYVLKQESTYIEDVFEAVADVAREKKEHFDDYSYDTGLKNEFNQSIRALQPTVMILDSIPTVASNDKKLEMEGGTYANRVAKALAQFYKRLTPIIKEANIIFIAINHINQKIEINPMMKTQPQLIYMKMDESMPGGNAPIYYAHNLFKFVTSGKLKAEDDGFDGFNVRCELMKSRTNKAGQFANLVYNQDLGFDPVMTQYGFANDAGVVDGRNPYRYFSNFKDVKFDSRKFRREFLDNEALRYAMFESTLPILEKQLSRVDPTETASAIHHLDVIDRLLVSQERDAEFEEIA